MRAEQAVITLSLLCSFNEDLQFVRVHFGLEKRSFGLKLESLKGILYNHQTSPTPKE